MPLSVYVDHRELIGAREAATAHHRGGFRLELELPAGSEEPGR
jgi:hypothetical protein